MCSYAVDRSSRCALPHSSNEPRCLRTSWILSTTSIFTFANGRSGQSRDRQGFAHSRYLTTTFWRGSVVAGDLRGVARLVEHLRPLWVKVSQLMYVPKPQITWPSCPSWSCVRDDGCEWTAFAKVDSGRRCDWVSPPQPFHAGSTPSAADVLRGLRQFMGRGGKH